MSTTTRIAIRSVQQSIAAKPAAGSTTCNLGKPGAHHLFRAAAPSPRLAAPAVAVQGVDRPVAGVT